MLRGTVLLLCAVCVTSARYLFFRSLERDGGSRRVFGGSEAPVGAWPGACALLNRQMESRCSCAVVSPRWALTAAHCAQPEVTYVQYNGRDRSDSKITSVKLLYSHPEFQAVEKDLGSGPDIVTLQHDVGLVFTRGKMLLSSYSYFPQPREPRLSEDIDFAEGLRRYNVDDLADKEIEVLGFGMTEAKPAGERLREVRLRLQACGRTGWKNCACLLGAARGVCSGDSGGPVLYNGTQIGVMSMGPVECGTPSPLGGLDAPKQAMSVFTALRPYASLINSTMHGVQSALQMRVVKLRNHSASRRVRFDTHSAICAASLLLCSGPFNVFDLDYMRAIRFTLNTVAQWPNRAFGPLTPWTGMLERYHYVMLFFSSCFETFSFLYVKKNIQTQDFIELGHDYLNVLMTFVMLQRMTLSFFANYRELVRQFVLDFHLMLHHDKNEFRTSEYRRINRICRIATAIILFQIFAAIVLYNMVPFFHNVKQGMFNENPPANKSFEHSVNYDFFLDQYTTKTGYYVAFVINFYPSYNVATALTCVDLLIFVIVFHIYGHLNVLVNDLRNFPRPKNSDDLDTIAGRREYNKEVSVVLKNVIQYDQWIKDFMTLTSETFSITLCLYLLFHQVTGCVLLLECSQMTAEAIGSYGVLTLILFQQLIQISVIFELISSKCDTLPDEVYGLPWELMDISNRRSVLLLLRNVQTSRALKACGVVPIGVVTMSGVIKTTCSYFLLLKTFT